MGDHYHGENGHYRLLKENPVISEMANGMVKNVPPHLKTPFSFYLSAPDCGAVSAILKTD